MYDRIHNFNAGPSTLPLHVLEEIRDSFLNYKNSGMSITEISHRSSLFEDIINDAILRTRRLLKLSDQYEVLFLQGGASMQFCMIPLNFLYDGKKADYINTGIWSTKAIAEAKIQNKNINIVASSEDRSFCYIPENISFNEDSVYVHLTSNNTIKGTQWAELPDTGRVPMVIDKSSDIMSGPLNMKDICNIGMIYAGAQKNMGPAGVCMVIIRKDMIELSRDNIPTMLRYKTYAENNSMYNTPPCFGIYVIQLVLKWLEQTVGGLEKMYAINSEKAALLYKFIDGSDFYKPTADKNSRSMMNVTFRLPDEELEKLFVDEALKNKLGGLKGHRSVGGCRASIYNATGLNAIQDIVSFMKDFQNKKG